MLRYLTIGKMTILAVAVVILGALALTGHAHAGASASAPSKYSHSGQMAAHQNGHKSAKNEFGITEYSSSSARHH